MIKCQICGKELHIINHLHLRIHGITNKEYRERFPDAPLVSEHMREELSRVPWNKGKPFMQGEDHPLYGKPRSEETREKIRESKKKYYETHDPWNKGLTAETDERMAKAAENMSIAKKENWQDPEFHQHMVEAHLGKWGEHPEDFGERIMAGKKTWAEIHQGMAKKNMAKFREQGFRVIPIDLGGHPRPDFIIMKEGKVYAVEIEVNSPPASKLEKWDDFPFFDDIIWIIREEQEK